MSRARVGMVLLTCATSAWCGVAITRGGVQQLVAFADALILIATAALLWAEPAQRRSAKLLLVAAVTLPLGDADLVFGRYGVELSHAERWWPLVPIAVVLLTYPSNTYARRWHLYLVRFATLDLVVMWDVSDLLWDPARHGHPGVWWWWTPVHVDQQLWLSLWNATGFAADVITLVVCVAFVQRWRLARGLERAAVRSVALVGIALALAVWARFMNGLLLWLGAIRVDHDTDFALLSQVMVALAPLALLVEVLRRRAAQMRVVDSLLAEGGGPRAIRDALSDALADPSLNLAVALDDDESPTDGLGWLLVDAGGSRPSPAEPDQPFSGRQRREIRAESGRLLGWIDQAESGVKDEAQVRTVLAAAAVVLDNHRLNAALLARIVELEDSRSRIAYASVAERRRVERDLHDGAQQMMLGVASSLGRLELVADDPTARQQALGDAKSQLMTALAELRRLAHGIHPALLSQAGLGPALENLAAGAAVETTARIPPELATARFPAAVEATAWFVAAEAVTNAVKHAAATHIDITLHRDRDELVLTVADNGRGGATIRHGGGLAGLVDRLTAIGGHCHLSNHFDTGHETDRDASYDTNRDTERGTTLTARLPCG